MDELASKSGPVGRHGSKVVFSSYICCFKFCKSLFFSKEFCLLLLFLTYELFVGDEATFWDVPGGPAPVCCRGYRLCFMEKEWYHIISEFPFATNQQQQTQQSSLGMQHEGRSDRTSQDGDDFLPLLNVIKLHLVLIAGPYGAANVRRWNH